MNILNKLLQILNMAMFLQPVAARPVAFAANVISAARGFASTSASPVLPLSRSRSRSQQTTLSSPILSSLSQRRDMAYSTSRASTEPTHTLHVMSTRNNVLLTFTNQHGQRLMRTVTGGSDKDFKKAHRSSYEAAHQASIKMFDCIRDYARGNPLSEKKVASSADGHQMKPRIRVAFKGMFGQGREAVASALLGPEGVAVKNMIVRMEDRTPIKIGGTRPRKARRL